MSEEEKESVLEYIMAQKFKLVAYQTIIETKENKNEFQSIETDELCVAVASDLVRFLKDKNLLNLGTLK